jgi:hypothetical protein
MKPEHERGDPFNSDATRSSVPTKQAEIAARSKRGGGQFMRVTEANGGLKVHGPVARAGPQAAAEEAALMIFSSPADRCWWSLLREEVHALHEAARVHHAPQAPAGLATQLPCSVSHLSTTI